MLLLNENQIKKEIEMNGRACLMCFDDSDEENHVIYVISHIELIDFSIEYCRNQKYFQITPISFEHALEYAYNRGLYFEFKDIETIFNILNSTLFY